jgi:hypothetical protein
VFCASEEGRKRSYSCLVGSRSKKKKKKKERKKEEKKIRAERR